ncbi:MAG: hypothetical protein IPG45_26480 [Deltaproteobacteria bacterium]|nr:hypothetical protein [Deltaproteobacteria bacterium]
MKRTWFLTIAGGIALLVGGIASLAPEWVLLGKGVPIEAAVLVWVREVGVAILAIGGMSLALRRHADSPALRVFLLGNAAHQVMLAPIEVVAYLDGTIPKLGGILPNTVLHVLLAAGFLAYGLGSRLSGADDSRPAS